MLAQFALRAATGARQGPEGASGQLSQYPEDGRNDRGSPSCYHPPRFAPKYREASSEATPVPSPPAPPSPPLRPPGGGDFGLLPVPRHPWRHGGLRRRGRPLAGGAPGRGRDPADHSPRRGVAAGDLAGRRDDRLLGEIRGADRGLHHAGRRRPAGAPDLRGGKRRGRGLDAGGRGPLRDLPRLGALFRAARAARSGDRPAPPRSSRPRERRQLRAGRQDPLLHPLRLPGQPHQALPGRQGPEPLAIPRRRSRGRPPDRRLPRHQQGADGLGGAGLLPFRPRRHP